MDTVEYTERMAEMECRASGTQRAAGDVRKASQGHKTAGQTARFALPPTPDSFNPPTDARLVSYITEVRRLPMDVIRGMKVTQASVMMPQVKAERLCIVFNYLHNGVLVNRKYRDSENICYTCLKKPVSLPVMAKLGIKTASVKNTKIGKNLFIQSLVGFISSFLGALIALLIIR